MNARRHEDPETNGAATAQPQSASSYAPRAGAASGPWQEQRARAGLNTLLRVIDLDADRQEFVILCPKDKTDLRDLEFDGATFILPGRERTAAEVAEILARFDARYWTDPDNKQTRVSVLDRERYIRARN